MGNQNTSGIATTTSEAPEIARVGSTHDQEADSHQGSEAAENEVSEEKNEGSVNDEDPETQTNDLPIGSIVDEMQDQPCTLKEEMQTSEIANPEDSPLLLESSDITSEPREDHDVILESTVESLLPADDSKMIQSDETDNEVKIGVPDEKAPPEDDETILENALITETKTQENEYPTSDICRVELIRKFASFDFGLEKTTEESDHTPLLYKDNIGATDKSVQIEHQEAAEEAEEKTMIRMEISNSARDDLSLNQPNNDSVSDKEKGIALEGSPRSTKGNEKRKPRSSSSSLFTTCMCCTAVIN